MFIKFCLRSEENYVLCIISFYNDEEQGKNKWAQRGFINQIVRISIEYKWHECNIEFPEWM